MTRSSFKQVATPLFNPCSHRRGGGRPMAVGRWIALLCVLGSTAKVSSFIPLTPAIGLRVGVSRAWPSSSRDKAPLAIRMAGIDPHALKEEVEAVRGMKAAEIKRILTEMKVGTTGIFEKEELVQKLAAERVSRRGGSGTTSTSSSEPSPGGDTWTDASWGSSSGSRETNARLTSAGIVVPMTRLRPSQGSLGASISVDQKDYFCIRLDLPDAPNGLATELFMLDTAATNSLLTPRASERLGARRTGVTATAAAGTSGVAGLFQVSLGEVQLAGQTCGKLEPVVMELPVNKVDEGGAVGEVVGILGMDFMTRFDVQVDFRGGDVTFAPPGAAMNGQLDTGGMTEIIGDTQANFFIVQVGLRIDGQPAGRPVPALVDLGSAFTIANWNACETAGLGPRDPLVRYTGQMVAGASAPGQQYNSVEVGEAMVGLTIAVGGENRRLPPRNIMVGNLPGVQAIGINGPVVILGSDVLKLGKGRMVMSSYSRRMWLAL
ncbi:unnamed protein product [Discosporangium mesarthrocarpum]